MKVLVYWRMGDDELIPCVDILSILTNTLMMDPDSRAGPIDYKKALRRLRFEKTSEGHPVHDVPHEISVVEE